MRRFAQCSLSSRRPFCNKGWDNAALDTIFKCLIRKPEVNEKIRDAYVTTMDPRNADYVRHMGDVAKEKNKNVRVYLPPMLGDPHRVLKAYSLTNYPILDEKGHQLKVEVCGHMIEAYADPDDDYSKVVIPQLEVIEFLAKELLTIVDWEASPRGAASLLESLYRGAEIPDHVFQSPAVIERHSSGTAAKAV